MTFPAATFTAVAPAPDGLALAFSAARRRRNSKAAMSAFAGAVAILSALSLMAPPGQSLVQEPPPPAQGGLLPGLSEAPRHGPPAPLVRTRSISVLVRTTADPLATTRVTALHPSGEHPGGGHEQTCGRAGAGACLVVRTPAHSGPTMAASVCASSATVTVDYDAPPVGPTQTSVHRTVAVGSCAG